MKKAGLATVLATQAGLAFGVDFTVGNCVISHSDVIAQEEVQQISYQYLDNTSTVTDCIAASSAIEQQLRTAGVFAARIYPEFHTDNRGVTLKVMEGALAQDGIEFTQPSKRVSEGTLEHILQDTLDPGSALTTAKYERAILLVNDLPGIKASHNVLYPANKVGEANFQFTPVDDRLTEGFIYADNFGSVYTGEYRVGGLFRLNSPFHYGEQFTFGVNASDEGTYFGNFDASTPIWLAGMRAGFTVDALSYQTDEANDLRGNSFVTEAYIHYPIIRARQSNLFIDLRLGRESMEDENDISTVTDRVVDAFTVKLQGDHIDGLLGGGENSMELVGVFGNLDLGGYQPYKELDSLTANTEGDFAKLAWKLTRLQHITGSWQSQVELAGQFASKELDSSQSIVFGGAYDFPGYKSGEILGDEGIRLHWDVRYNTAIEAIGGQQQVAVFYDIGSIETHALEIVGGLIVPGIDSERYTLQSAGVSFSQIWTSFQLQGALGWALDNEIPDNLLDNDISGMHAWLQIGYSF